VLIMPLLEESNVTRVEVAKEQPDLEPKGFRGSAMSQRDGEEDENGVGWGGDWQAEVGV
jgi:hypothetical protein